MGRQGEMAYWVLLGLMRLLRAPELWLMPTNRDCALN